MVAVTHLEVTHMPDKDPPSPAEVKRLIGIYLSQDKESRLRLEGAALGFLLAASLPKEAPATPA